jgi:8-oxo-dGTP diphosphatase
MNIRQGPAVAVDAIIERNSEALLIKRKNPPFKDRWALPGGFVEYGEPLEDALRREVKEETSLDVEIKRLHGVYSDPKRDPRGHVISICYVASGRGEPAGGDDAVESRFFLFKELLKLNLAFDHNRILKDFLEDKDVL